MISRLFVSALIIHGLETMNANEMLAKTLLMMGAIVIMFGIKHKEQRIRASFH
jgi:hypothetical protein